MRFFRASVFIAILITSLTARAEKPWPIRAVVVTTFETGNDTGDAPGEFQFWVEREHLDEVLPFPGGVHPLRTNKDHTILGMVSGTTLVNATASMMALGLDPRIASIGSAAWARYVIGDVAREIDPREAPKDWPYGIFPTSAKQPNPPSIEDPVWHRSNLFTLNQSLVQWAFDQTRSLKLPDDPAVAAFRTEYTNMPAAQRPPFVLIGDTFASDYY